MFLKKTDPAGFVSKNEYKAITVGLLEILLVSTTKEGTLKDANNTIKALAIIKKEGDLITVENTLVKKTDFNTRISEIEDKINKLMKKDNIK